MLTQRERQQDPASTEFVPGFRHFVKRWMPPQLQQAQ